jgi:hypothetical protein
MVSGFRAAESGEGILWTNKTKANYRIGRQRETSELISSPQAFAQEISVT